MESAITCTVCALEITPKVPASHSYNSFIANTNPNLKYFGYYHSDGFAANIEDGGYAQQIIDMQNSNVLMINYNWNAASENNYGTKQRVAFAQKNGIHAWVQVRGLTSGTGMTYSGGTYYLSNLTLLSNWKSVFDEWYNALEEYINDGTLLGFYFDEPRWLGWSKNDFITVTRYMREKNPKIRILTCASPTDIGIWVPSNRVVNGVSGAAYPTPDKEYHQYVTDVTYDSYGYWDYNTRQDCLQRLKNISPDTAMIWATSQGSQVQNTAEQTDWLKKSLIGFYEEAVNEPRYAGILQYSFAGKDSLGDGYGGRHYLVPGVDNSVYSEDLRQLNITIGRKVIRNSIAVQNDVIASFDDSYNVNNYAGDQSGNGWNRTIDTGVKRSGHASIKITPSSSVAKWPNIQFKYNGKTNFNLSGAESITIYARSAGGTISALGVQAKDSTGKYLDKKVSFGTSWTALTITKAELDAAGVNSSSFTFGFCDLTGSQQKTAFYLDDLTVSYSTTSTGHDFTGAYGYDSTHHWKTCADCGMANSDGKALHTGGTATCTERAKCSTCGASYGSVSGHNYVLKTDANYHWYECTICGGEKPYSKVSHTGTATCTARATCTICNVEFGELASHDFTNGTWKTDGTSHWKKCANCTVEDTANKTSHAGGSATCTTKARCLTCNAEYGTSLGHDFAGSVIYISDGDNHMKRCIRCEEGDTANKSAHTGGTATCTTGKVCEFCGLVYTSPAGHDWDEDTWLSDDAYHWNKCINCDAENTEGKQKHNGGNVTCDQARTCIICNNNYGSATGHDFDNGEFVTDGTYHWKKCANCTVEDTDNKEEHYGGKATCQIKAICEGCYSEYGDFASHDWDLTSWDANAEGHARECKTVGCGALDTRVNHTPDRDEPTNELPVKCTVCDFTIAQETGHTHSAKDVWSNDANNHWKDCVGDDGEKFELASHDFANACDTTCDTCGYTRTVTHDFANGEYKSDDTHHWKQCANCTVIDTAKSVHKYTDACDETCNDCGYVREVTHDFDNGEWMSNGTHHWKQCSRCSAVDTDNKVDHSYDNACDATCNVCNYNRGTSHDFDSSDVYKSDSTYHWKKCANCDVYDDTHKVIHSYSDNCDSFCDDCNYDRKRTHDFTSSNVYGSDGTHHWKKCARCDVYDVEHKSTHQGGVSSCTVQKQCTICGTSYGELANHDFANSTTYISANNQHWKQCKNCTAQDTDNKVDCLGGSATCIKKANCDVCGAIYGELGPHDFDSSTAYASDGTNHWKKCARTGCTGEDTENKSTCSGGTATCKELATCSTCKNAYGAYAAHKGGTATDTELAKCEVCGKGYGEYATHRDFTFTSFDSVTDAKKAGGTTDDLACWPRAYSTEQAHTGSGSLKVTPHAEWGTWPGITFMVGTNDTFDLSTATSIRVYMRAATKEIEWLFFEIQNASDKNVTYRKNLAVTTTGWTEFKIDLATAKAEVSGLNLSAVKIVIGNGTKSSIYVNDRVPFYVDDLIINDVYSSTKWDNLQAEFTYAYYSCGDDWPPYVQGTQYWSPDNGATINRLWDSNDTRSTNGSFRIIPHASYGTYNSVQWKDVNNSSSLTWDLTNATTITVYAKMLDGSAQNKFQLKLVDSADATITYVAPSMAANAGWVEFTLDVAAYRASNPTKDLSSVKIAFGSTDGYSNRGTFLLDDFTVKMMG